MIKCRIYRRDPPLMKIDRKARRSQLYRNYVDTTETTIFGGLYHYEAGAIANSNKRGAFERTVIPAVKTGFMIYIDNQDPLLRWIDDYIENPGLWDMDLAAYLTMIGAI